MKLFLIALLFLLSYHCCTGYPVVEGEDLLLQNGTPIQSWFDLSNDTASNDSSPLGMLESQKKLVDKIRSVLRIVRDKMNEGFDKANDFLSENGTSIDYWLDASNDTASNDSSLLDMYGFGKKVVNKVKEGIKTVKDKVKDKYDKVKNKISDFRDKIGSKGGGSGGGGSGGGYFRDRYDRDNNRDSYDRDYYRRSDDDDSVGSGVPDPNAKWVGLGIGIFLIVGISIVLIYYKCKGDI